FYLQRGAPGDERPMLAIAQLSYDAFPNSPFALNDVAYFYGSRGDWSKSLEFLLRAERADSSDALVLYNLGWAHENLGHRGEAIRYYRRALVVGEAGRRSDVTQS